MKKIIFSILVAFSVVLSSCGSGAENSCEAPNCDSCAVDSTAVVAVADSTVAVDSTAVDTVAKK